MEIIYNGHTYWMTDNGSVYVLLVNKYGVDYERRIKRGTKTYNAVIKLMTGRR